jgi:hypothetical protein
VACGGRLLLSGNMFGRSHQVHSESQGFAEKRISYMECWLAKIFESLAKVALWNGDTWLAR